MSAEDRLRIGIVGYGGSGRGIHARLARKAGHDVRGVVVRSEERVAQVRADWPAAVVHPDLDTLLATHDEVDLVVVTSPTGLHEEHAAAVLRAGVPLLMDKPLALSGDGAAAVLDVSRSTGTPFTVFQNRRWDPEQLTLRAVLASGDLGTVHRFERRWERWRPVPQQRWKEQDPDGGGLLLDLGTHLVDSAVQLFGPVQSVYAELRAITTPTEDDVFLSLHHVPASGTGRGVVSHLTAGSVVGAPGPRTRVLGDAGAYVVTTFENDASPFEEMDADAPQGSEGWIARGRERTAVPQAPGGHEDFYPAVAAWVLDGAPAPVDPEDVVRTARVLDAARVSARTGERVTV
ncbi:Gfo/Idh/MocA family protein [Sanguibacter suaedae]|uniref:Gfo/Idh/MocA family oxidoreductase n=1 Tax=Sanguibacter suaedae TaxID=2795737 RepID=A0A934IAD0_9MICO|nr:Gfo/Idh/MocA family oxidoreductase [Sanguibacter suaedae]MBI9114278.1 Gfo/Idh/MocA family oxidoreductase [Sanguibacter suaedae]